MDIYTAEQVAARLGITPDAVRARIRRGLLRAERVGRDWLIAGDEVERVAAAGRLSPGPRRAETDEAKRRAARRQAAKQVDLNPCEET